MKRFSLLRRRLLSALPRTATLRVAAPLLLLLIPLGVLKWRLEWRAEHPPVSRMDQQLRARLGASSEVHIGGFGPTWGTLSGLRSDGQFGGDLVLKGNVVRELTQALRTTDHWQTRSSGKSSGKDFIAIVGNSLDLFYWHDATGSYLASMQFQRKRCVVVQPRFAPRFEALIARLAARAKSPGPHPEIVIGHKP